MVRGVTGVVGTLDSKVRGVLKYLFALDSMVRGALEIFGTLDSEVRGALKYFLALDFMVRGALGVFGTLGSRHCRSRFLARFHLLH